ncbi:hypothetical protein SAMN00017477_2130 [Peptoniphilus asaccharolyticus DSM 20463]|uniref:Uncharacterized protein n=1 Tax=Peptoniphilus asaccharolyticus DSM 20463 TaxID=573058 RepID=A0A1W1VKB5_PEPAS|nr:hypothetical protein [Peptoniphilus asaccharolyticus]MBL7574445.1 hypothetical protein [Peptoniphilus asaccharolyticus]SMB93756.1 hypothetical protein SAMN00017477_2130 [Peptoniphilus asaccharolyticus DSM 20463]
MRKMIVILFMAVVMINGSSDKLFAQVDKPYDKAPALQSLYEQGKVEKVDYYNPTTGEYFAWVNPNEVTLRSAGHIAKYFSYDIRWNVTSDAFIINSSDVRVYSNGHLKDGYGNYINADFPYKIHLRTGWFGGADLSYNTRYSEESRYTQTNRGGKYTLTVSVDADTDNYGPGARLVGSGRVEELN